MRAAVVTRFGSPLELLEVPRPEPAPHEILVRVTASGVCHTDLHAAHGDWPTKPVLPLIPGHEAVGVVAACGAGVTSLRVGDRVGVPWLHRTCGHCDYCLSGWETLCETQVRTGYDVDGGFAEYVLADPNYVGRIPEGLDDVAAAPLLCAGVTVYKGLSMLQARPGDWVLVSGIGGLGHLAVQYGQAMGFRVIAVDITDAKLDLAARLGADLTVNAATTDPVGYIQREVGGAHGALVTAVSRAAFSQAIRMVRRGGTVALNGVPPGDFPLNIFDVVMRAITVRGSIVGTRLDLSRALALAAAGHAVATVHTASLADINDVLTKLQAWPVEGRFVLDLRD